MSKRENDGNDDGQSSSKSLKTSPENEILALPIEIILRIILSLNEAKDVKNCLELSKEIRHFMLKSATFFHKFQIVIKSISTEGEVADFLTNYGGNITTLKLIGRDIEQQLLTFIMKSVPNLEEYSFSIFHTLNRSKIKRSKRSFELPKLKKLAFLNESFSDFLLDAKKLDNLESFSIYDHRNDHDELLTDFVVKLDNLKELNLIYYNYKKNPEDFPTRDIRNEVKFKLTKLSHSLNFDYFQQFNPNMISFFESQAENLKELRLDGDQVESIFDIMYNKCCNLEKLTVRKSEYCKSSLFFCEPSDGEFLNEVKHFVTGEIEHRELEFICKRFPSLESLECDRLSNVEGTFKNLINLKVNQFWSLDIKLPNLKTWICENAHGKTKFDLIAPKLEELRMLRAYLTNGNPYIYLHTFKVLKRYPKLRKYEATFYYEYGKPDYKISVDMTKKKVVVSSHLFEDYDMFKDVFEERFSNFELSFC